LIVKPFAVLTQGMSASSLTNVLFFDVVSLSAFVIVVMNFVVIVRR
jgi:hypothetical protein